MCWPKESLINFISRRKAHWYQSCEVGWIKKLKWRRRRCRGWLSQERINQASLYCSWLIRVGSQDVASWYCSLSRQSVKMKIKLSTIFHKSLKICVGVMTTSLWLSHNMDNLRLVQQNQPRRIKKLIFYQETTKQEQVEGEKKAQYP